MKTRIIGGILAVVLAVAGALVIMAYVRGADQRALAGARTVDVLVVSELIVAGTAAAEVEGLVDTTAMPASAVVVGGVQTLDQIVGLVATVDLQPGEQLLASRFAAVVDVAVENVVEVPTGMQEVSISVDAPRSVGASITPGSTVGVFASNPAGADGPYTHLLLHKVLVTRVQGLAAAPEPATAEEAAAATLPIPAPVLVTFAVSAADAERIVFAAEYGTIWLSDEPATAVESGAAGQTWGSVYG